MKTNNNSSECALKINQVLSIVLVLMILGTSMGMYTTNSAKIVAEVNENSIQEIQLAEVTETTSDERQFETTSRSAEERMVEEPQPTYISIEEIEISRDMDLT